MAKKTREILSTKKSDSDSAAMPPPSPIPPFLSTNRNFSKQPFSASGTLAAIIPYLRIDESLAVAHLSALSWHLPRLALTVEETAEATGLSRSFLYVEISEYRLRAVKPGGTTRILIWDLIDYLRTRPAFEVTK